MARVHAAYDRRFDDLRSVSRSEQERLDAEMRALDERLKAARKLDIGKLGDAALLADVRDALLLPDASWMRPPPPPSLLERLKAAFQRFVAWLRRLFGGKRAVPKPEPKPRTVTFATLSAGGRTLGASEIGDAMAQLTPRQQEELAQNVQRSIQAKERNLEREAEVKRRDAEAQRRALEAERKEAELRAQREAEQRLKDVEKARLTRELKERGFVTEHAGELTVTYGLVERFARLILEEESRQLKGDARFSLRGGAATGLYEKARLRQADEIAHLDVPSSLLAARQQGLKHIDETTSYIYREITSERVHVVLAFDKSGSMAEGGKLLAAKKALLALFVAIQRRHHDATIDLVAFENEVRVLDLLELWECSPGSFTNTAEALHTAHLLLRSSRATRKEFYLITDGLPEAYTDETGVVRSGNLDAAMDRALERAVELSTVTPLTFSMILLKSTHPEYEVAARKIAKTLSGDLVITDPQHLGVELLVRWAGGTETTRRNVAPPPPPETAAAPKARRRKADRRMGG